MTVHQSIADETRPAYNYAYLDEQTKRMIRRALLKAVAVPGYQVPFGSAARCRSPYGWGTGGVQVTAAIIGPGRCAQGHRPGRRRHHQRRVDPRASSPSALPRWRCTTEATDEATIIQTRHRIPEAKLTLKAGQVHGLPGAAFPSRCRKLEPHEAETRKMHALGPNTG
jgi:alpha-D-ribose 1-methylphosphonate 5-phosphate C-P lyase